MRLKRSKWMKFSFGIYICFVGFFCCVKTPDIFWTSVNTDTSKEAFFSFLQDNYAEKSSALIASMGAFYILIIFILRSFTKIREAIISFISIDMVNPVDRPFTCHVEPRQSVQKISFAIYFSRKVTPLWMAIAHNISGSCMTASGYIPSHYPGFWLVMNKLAQAFRSNIGLSHEASRMLIGEKPANDRNSFTGFAIIHEAWGG